MSTTTQLSGLVVTTASSPVPGATITWSSLNPSIATVSATGLVTPIAAGVATIRATYLGIHTDYPVTVSGAAGGISTYLTHTFATNSASVPGTADTGQVALVLTGTWGVRTQRLYLAVSTSNDVVVWDAGHADGTVSVDATTLDSPVSAEWRFVFRCSDATNLFQMIAQSPTQWALYKTVAGVSTQLGLWTTVAPASGQTVVAVLNGSSITMKIGATTLGTVTETFNQTATRIGALSGGGTGIWEWDNLSMTSATS